MLPIPPFQLNTIPTLMTRPQHTGAPIRKLLSPLLDESGAVVPDEYVCAIDWSSIESFTTCDRSAMWKLVYSRIGRRSAALTFGSAIHKGLEMFYETMHTAPLTMAEVNHAVEQIFLRDGLPPSALEWRTPELALTQLQKYFTKHSVDDAHWQVQHVEQAFRLPICTIDVNSFLAYTKVRVLSGTDDNHDFFVKRIHFLWTGVIDLIIRDQDQTWIVDHKTTSIEGESLWKSYELSQQFQGYMWAATQLGVKPAGIIANVIYSRPPAKSDAAQKSQAAKAFMRQRYYTREERLQEWHTSMSHILADFTHHLTTGHFPMKTQWCCAKYGTCPYHDVCTLPPAQRLTMLHTNQYEDNTWNPLN